MNSTLTLADLTARSGLDVLDHLDKEVTIPIIDGMQAQGDLIVIPRALVADSVQTYPAQWQQKIPTAGLELLRSAAGGNPHVLVADEGNCEWCPWVRDAEGLALGILDTEVTAYLIHPEHGGTGIAPGRYVIRRQRENSRRTGFGARRSEFYLVAD
ncbi:hypothetical protein [Antrihabitans cavernicola]|uniref:Uncharacterized protein n=1 Tax=Antrihabitans cavernicola TaxID=2495913 RepID=A0A5A7SEP4_9NOCA|nr:hypothetical protein [Spelaeibacter cavernicola]KAA0023612.1 hypothetical protein FOY51_09500 [Spelaeibacter cavernicola]